MRWCDCPDPSWKVNPDIVADESFDAVYGEDEDENSPFAEPWAVYEGDDE